LVKLLVLSPILTAELYRADSSLFKPRASQLEHVEYEAERYRAHLEFEQLMARAPPMRAEDLRDRVRLKLAEDEAALMEENCVSLTELIADSTYTAVVTLNVLANLSAVKRIQVQVGREFFSMDSSRQAFLLLLCSDILVGYHSSEGWATWLTLVADHYGIEEKRNLTALFIAVVPVSFDVLFKYWCYSSLVRLAPLHSRRAQASGADRVTPIYTNSATGRRTRRLFWTRSTTRRHLSTLRAQVRAKV
jgi:hypothetical protein